jgi:hypothetical protein
MSIKDNFPPVRPQLLIDIANTELLDPRVVSTRATVATYYDKFGVLQTAGANVPRVGYNPSTGAVEGLIREAQGTNISLYSQDFSSWALSNGRVEPDSVNAPDGTISAGLLWKASNSSSNIGTVTTATPSISVGAFFNTSTGELTYVSTGNVVSSGFYDIGDGWFRVYFYDGTYVVSGYIKNYGYQYVRFSLSTNFLQLASSSSPNSLAGPTTDTGVYVGIWGMQVEANSYPTSYIKTEASQVTRAADSFLLTNSSTYDTDAFTAISQPFGVTSVSSGTVTLNGDVPIERLYVYPNNLPQDEINSVVENDGWWNWRIVGATFALPSFTTDGSIQVDWGDGTVETLTTAVHTFTNASPHTIRFRQMTGTWFRPAINTNATYKTMVVAVGSAPSNMIVDCFVAFRQCTNLKSFDATLIGKTDYSNCFESCTSLKSFPIIDTTSATSFASTWFECSQLQSFPLLDTSSVINFTSCWQSCTSLTSFPLLDTSAGTNFSLAFRDCTSLTSFPLINVNASTYFYQSWYGNTSLTSFPANMFDSWTGVPISACFTNTWLNCTALTTTSVENILVSIDTSGTSAPAGNTEITISYNVATGALTSPTTSAITSLKGKNWTIRINGVLQ